MDRINGADTFDIGGGRRGFRSESLPSGVAGTEVTALFLNSVQEEIMKVIVGAGLAPDAADWSQLWQALKVLGLSRGNRNNRWTAVKAINVTAPPAAPADGDIYLVPAAATGAWAGHAGAIAEWVDAAWSYYVAPDGHGIGLPDGRLFMKIAGDYVEWLEGLPLSLSKLSRMPWIPVISMTLSSAPGAPARGDCYLVPTGASGIWATSVGKIAEWTGTAWAYSTPADGHGLSLPDGRVFERVSGAYVEKIGLDVQSGKWSFAAAGGSANALTATLNPAPAALADGMQIALRIATTNTGASTLNLNGLGAKPIKTSTGGDTAAGDLVANSVVRLHYSQSANAYILPTAKSATEAMLRATKPSYMTFSSKTVALAADVVTAVSLTGAPAFFAGGTAISGSSLTIGQDDGGLWQLNMATVIRDSTESGSVGAYIRVNNVDKAAASMIRDIGAMITKAANCATILPLVAGDVVTFHAAQSNMGSTKTMDLVLASAARVGAA